MLDADLRNAIHRLHSEGMEIRKISKQLRVSRNTVREIIKQGGKVQVMRRGDRITVDKELVTELYKKCDGWVERVHDLIQERGIKIGYSTLTRLVREYELGKPARKRCSHVDDVPGAEMQHDTSPYKIKIAGVLTRVTASLLYFRYCKHRYLKFYRPFTRFQREKPHLKNLSTYVSEPYEDHERQTDEYGYVALHANYYWVPGTKCDVVKVLEYRHGNLPL